MSGKLKRSFLLFSSHFYLKHFSLFKVILSIVPSFKVTETVKCALELQSYERRLRGMAFTLLTEFLSLQSFLLCATQIINIICQYRKTCEE